MKTHINDLFDQMEPEKGNKLDDKIKVDNSEISELLETLYKVDSEKMELEYDEMTQYLKSLNSKKYSAKTITKFSKVLTDEIIAETLICDTGRYINFLIQESDDQNHFLFLDHLETLLLNIGEQNTKNLEVTGDLADFVGLDMKDGKLILNGTNLDCLGSHMSGGTIILNGNTHSNAGHYMTNGRIIIHGNALHEVGWGMSDGLIQIKGSSKRDVGREMSGGRIEIEGDFDSLGYEMKKGDIYHKGRQIVKNGKVLSKNYQIAYH